VICKDKDTQIPGVPQIKNGTVYLPQYFIQYVYEFYYNYRVPIFTCLIAHEIAHAEYGLPDKPPKQHYLCDKAAIENMLIKYTPYNENHYYSKLKVVSDYWSARKGVGGHLANVGWNVFNMATLAYVGVGSLGNLYATDISTRLKLMKKDHPSVRFIFTR
jgi:hypothetical protein